MDNFGGKAARGVRLDMLIFEKESDIRIRTGDNRNDKIVFASQRREGMVCRNYCDFFSRSFRIASLIDEALRMPGSAFR